MSHAWVIGGGPAGLMAAEVLARAGAKVTLADAKPSMGRKFLMAGKSGLNLTRDEPLEGFLANYHDAADWLRPMVAEFGPAEVQAFAQGLGQEVFTGSSGRVFPSVMKASPMLRAWFARLDGLGVIRRTRMQWRGWDGDDLLFDTVNGDERVTADAIVFALGGASWARLGSDGAWAKLFAQAGVSVTPFAPSNVALDVAWSDHMRPHFGTPLKAVAFTAGDLHSRGEAIVSARGLEGGGVYSVSRAVREGEALSIDLLPDWTESKVADALGKPRGKTSLANHLRKSLKLSKLAAALLNEWTRPLPQSPDALAQIIKALPVRHAGLRPMDEAISTAGGVARDAVTPELMLHAKPGQFCAGEMLDWDAPTGGYLLTACMATGRRAGRSAARYLGLG
ncbi:MAG: TIGR03862 family flavoprotein [Pseudomonadota bacterium]